MKTCSKCGVSFHGKKWEESRCRDCRLKIGRLWRSKNRDKLRGYAAKARAANPELYRQRVRNATWKMWGLSFTWDDFARLLRAQGDRCAICRTPDPGKRGFYLDHDHAFRQVRGILCRKCNSSLGYMKDSPRLLRAAANYLEAHQPKLKLAGS